MNPVVPFNSDSNLKFPSAFLRELKINNLQKDKSTPIALILQAPYDINGILSNACTQSLIMQIAQTHRVILKTFSEISDLKTQIEDTFIKTKNKVSLLMILAHGQLDNLQLRNESFYKQTDFNSDDFLFLNPKAKIILYSCHTGGSFAQKIADVANRTVFAPLNTLYDATTCIDVKDRKFRILSYDENGVQHMCAFRKNQSFDVLTPNKLYSISNHNSFCQMAEYLKNAAELGDADAASKLALFYEYGRGGLEQSDEKALYWFNIAADKNNALAQLNLGYFHLRGRAGLEPSEQEALHWFTKAAEQRVAWAQYNLALFYLNGLGGLELSNENAVYYFSLAAAQGLPEAIYNLGVLYEFGKGVTLSIDVAEQLYKIATNMGINQAKVRLNILNSNKKTDKKIDI